MLTKSEIDARMEAYEQCITLLECNWTDDPEERRQGNILRDQLRSQSTRWHEARSRRIVEAESNG